jgi:hypothetical protein
MAYKPTKGNVSGCRQPKLKLAACLESDLS